MEEAAEMGRPIARLHRALAANAQTPTPSSPSPPDPTVLVSRWRALKSPAEARPHPDPFDQLVIQFADHAARSLPDAEEPEWNLLPWQTCHRDLHLDNLLFGSDGRITAVLDFDNAGPWWPGAELMMVWNLSIPTDPGEPLLNAAGAALFAAYARKAGWSGSDLAELPLLYWHGLLSNTWPAPQRYRSATEAVPPDWLEILAMRLRAAVWLEDYADQISDWLRQLSG